MASGHRRKARTTCYHTTYDNSTVNLIDAFIEEEFTAFPVDQHDDMLDCLARIADPALRRAGLRQASLAAPQSARSGRLRRAKQSLGLATMVRGEVRRACGPDCSRGAPTSSCHHGDWHPCKLCFIQLWASGRLGVRNAVEVAIETAGKLIGLPEYKVDVLTTFSAGKQPLSLQQSASYQLTLDKRHGSEGRDGTSTVDGTTAREKEAALQNLGRFTVSFETGSAEP